MNQIDYRELVDLNKAVADLWDMRKQIVKIGEFTVTEFFELNANAITELLIENQALRNAANGFKKQAEAAESRAEKAERERNSVVQFLTSVIRHGTNPCECCKADCIDAGSDDAEYVSQCGMFEWSNPQNDMYVFGEGEE